MIQPYEQRTAGRRSVVCFAGYLGQDFSTIECFARSGCFAVRADLNYCTDNADDDVLRRIERLRQ